jgi:hypothetical protein
LEERTATFGEAVIRFARPIPRDAVGAPLISQLVRAATSVGANYCEADDTGSRKEFRHLQKHEGVKAGSIGDSIVIPHSSFGIPCPHSAAVCV